MAGERDRIIGDYKIEPDFLTGRFVVRKALGPWPMRNWSWVTLFAGTAAQCREYIRWAERIDAGDSGLLGHAADYLVLQCGAQVRAESVKTDFREFALHLPKMQGYDFTKALLRFPLRPATEFSGELLAVFIAVAVLFAGGFIYHSM